MADVSLQLRRLIVPVLVVFCIGLFALSRFVNGEERSFSEADLWTSIVAVGLALSALFMPAWLRGSVKGTAANIPWASLFFVLAWMVGMLTQLLLGPEHAIVAPIAALGVGAPVLFLAWWLWLLPLRPVYRLQKLKSDPAALDAAIERILRRLGAWKPQGNFSAKRQSQVAIVAASVLTDMRRWNDASRALESVAVDLLDPYRRSLVQAMRAVALVYQGQRRAAWDAMKDADKHSAGNPALQQSIAINGELIASLDGPAAPVLKRLDEIGRPRQAIYQRGWLLARANALAASGDTAGARAALEELAAVAPDGLERAVELKGPASQLAKEMQALPG